MAYKYAVLGVLLFLLAPGAQAQSRSKAVIAYYAGSLQGLDSFDARSMTHLIYCFGHLQGTAFHLKSAEDTMLIQKMVAMKQQNPQLKILLSLGGWGGCETCSAVFATKEGRRTFALSVKKVTAFLGTDGIDLDWEYPTIAGYPGHQYTPADKKHFTALLKTLRKTLGRQQTITFAAGGFQHFLDASVNWKKVLKQVDYVNLMTYDLVSGYATTTGHHTALYSTPAQHESTDNCVQYLLKKGVAPGKLIIGAAFYARVWAGVVPANNGLYQSGTFTDFIGYNEFGNKLSADSGFVRYWDDTAKAPYAYNAVQKRFATFDDKQSIEAKTNYVMRYNLGGIMFWQLGHDTSKDGLLHTINQTLQQSGDTTAPAQLK